LSITNNYFSADLDIDRLDLVTCLLLDKLLGLNRTEEEVYSMYGAYAEFLQVVKSGRSPVESRFLSEMETLREVLKDDAQYLPVVDTIIDLWNR
jgi:hypothetical protein